MEGGLRQQRKIEAVTEENAAKEDCPICLYLAENPRDGGYVSDLLTFTSNPTAAFFMSKALGEKVSSPQISSHKANCPHSYSAPFSQISRLYSALDLSTEDGQMMAIALDSFHGLLLSPGKTSPRDGLSAIKMLADRKDKKQDDGSEFVEAMFKIVLENIKDGQDRKAVAGALKHWQQERRETGND